MLFYNLVKKIKMNALCMLLFNVVNALYMHCVSTIFSALSFLRFTFGQTSIDQENQGSLTESIQDMNGINTIKLIMTVTTPLQK